MADDRHEDKSDRDGSKEHYDHWKTKDVSESGGGKHDKEDRDDE
ncbi:MAG: hypothetical protein ACREQ5_14245 [Candidatus Dormibacteria bacterium]